MTIPPSPTYLRPEALAERWGVSPKSLANARCRGGGIPYVKIGAAVRYALADVIAYEQSQRVEAVA
ncbi:MAG TPA: helix-turn-helix domain-containing protein [Nocardioides sp.]|nr:helix-turn-helix domain-containing protein [Nocardioides sp.]